LKKDVQSCREWLEKGLCAILPKYEENGANTTDIFFEDGDKLNDKRKVKSVINAIAQFYQKDLLLIKGHASKTLSQKTMLPISIAPDLILVPFKVRKPIGQNDGAVGYIFHSALLNLEKAPKGCILRLKGETQIKVFENLKTAQKRFENGDKMRQSTVRYTLKNEATVLAFREMKEECDRPATRGDIALLSKNLLSVMEKLGI